MNKKGGIIRKWIFAFAVTIGIIIIYFGGKFILCEYLGVGC